MIVKEFAKRIVRGSSNAIVKEVSRNFAVTTQKAVVLEGVRKIAVRDIEIDETLGDRDIRIDLKRVGICGSDVHYYTHGEIGHFKVNEPMILGHEASGIVSEVGSEVSEFKVGDRVCMEPGIPNPQSKPSRLGMYNLCPSLTGYH
jgi:D-xylulose reductase